jgi:hypothetical protein
MLLRGFDHPHGGGELGHARRSYSSRTHLLQCALPLRRLAVGEGDVGHDVAQAECQRCAQCADG